jgi:DNA-binding transcriptional LysR family regulator
LAGERTIPLSRLAHEPLLLREPGSTARMTLEGVFRDLGMPIRESMTLGSSEAVKQGVMGGFGLSILSSFEVSLEVASGLLTILDVKGFPLGRRWYVVYFTDKRLSLPAKTFSAFILSEEGRKTAAASHVATPERPAA